MSNLYPFLFQPNLKTVVWGGDRLVPYKGLDRAIFTQTPYGESWEVSAIEGSESIIANGSFCGQKLTDIIAQYPEAILGKKTVEKYGANLPLLMKFIDADKDLSIQVHPNDEMARREHNKMVKSEMWYIIDAKPGSYLYAGFKEKITPYEYKKRVEDGTITEVLAKHEVKAGDVFFLPAGRVHAICGGILLAEIQQSSDVTYRIYDYNRLGLDGKPRELHTELASQALDYEIEEEYRTQYNDQVNVANQILSTPYFSCRILNLSKEDSLSGPLEAFHRNLLKYDSFIISTCIQGACSLINRINGSRIELICGNSVLIPAAIADYDVVPHDKKCQLLDSFIDNKDLSLPSRINRFLHITDK